MSNKTEIMEMIRVNKAEIKTLETKLKDYRKFNEFAEKNGDEFPGLADYIAEMEAMLATAKENSKKLKKKFRLIEQFESLE